MRVVALMASLFVGRAGALELTQADWESKTAGKSVFIKFQAPWCGHCKSMKPAWDKLMAEYKDDANRLIADVDCTAAGKDLCSQIGVSGYPTIKQGDPNGLEDYKGGRDFDALKAFAESLGPSCSPANLDLCDAAKKKQIQEFTAMSEADLNKAIAEKDTAMKKAEDDNAAFLKSLQAQYEEATKKKDATQKDIKESGMGLMKSVLAHRKSEKNEL